jgi:hypothetical protein
MLLQDFCTSASHHLNNIFDSSLIRYSSHKSDDVVPILRTLCSLFKIIQGFSSFISHFSHSYLNNFSHVYSSVSVSSSFSPSSFCVDTLIYIRAKRIATLLCMLLENFLPIIRSVCNPYTFTSDYSMYMSSISTSSLLSSSEQSASPPPQPPQPTHQEHLSSIYFVPLQKELSPSSLLHSLTSFLIVHESHHQFCLSLNQKLFWGDYWKGPGKNEMNYMELGTNTLSQMNISKNVCGNSVSIESELFIPPLPPSPPVSLESPIYPPPNAYKEEDANETRKNDGFNYLDDNCSINENLADENSKSLLTTLSMEVDEQSLTSPSIPLFVTLFPRLFVNNSIQFIIGILKDLILEDFDKKKKEEEERKEKEEESETSIFFHVLPFFPYLLSLFASLILPPSLYPPLASLFRYQKLIGGDNHINYISDYFYFISKLLYMK